MNREQLEIPELIIMTMQPIYECLPEEHGLKLTQKMDFIH